MRKAVVLALCLVMSLAVVPVEAKEVDQGFDARRVVVSNEGVFFEGDLAKDAGNHVFYMGAVGIGFGYRIYQQNDQYFLARVGVGKNGGSFGIYFGKDFEYQGRVLDGRFGFVVDGGKPKFSLGAGLRF